MASKAGTSLSRKRDGSVELEVVERPRVSSIDSLSDPNLFVNRELSLLAFQRRVLEEAQDPTNPLLERVKFLSILGSNLDEFFMVRVAGLMRQVESGTVRHRRRRHGRRRANWMRFAREVASIMAAAQQVFSAATYSRAGKSRHSHPAVFAARETAAGTRGQIFSVKRHFRFLRRWHSILRGLSRTSRISA